MKKSDGMLQIWGLPVIRPLKYYFQISSTDLPSAESRAQEFRATGLQKTSTERLVLKPIWLNYVPK